VRPLPGGEVATHFDGVIDATSGASTISAASIVNSGTLEVTGGTLTIDAASTCRTPVCSKRTAETSSSRRALGNAEIGGASLPRIGRRALVANVTSWLGLPER